MSNLFGADVYFNFRVVWRHFAIFIAGLEDPNFQGPLDASSLFEIGLVDLDLEVLGVREGAV